MEINVENKKQLCFHLFCLVYGSWALNTLNFNHRPFRELSTRSKAHCKVLSLQCPQLSSFWKL